MTFLLIASFADSILHFRGQLIAALLARGLVVHVAAPGLAADSDMRAKLRACGVTVHDIPLHRTGMNPFKDLRTLKHLVVLMRTIRPDITLAYTIKPAIYGSLAASLMRVPRRFVLITGLGYAFTSDGANDGKREQRGSLRSLAQWLYKLALGGVDKVLFQNPDDEALFRALGILSPTSLSFVINGSGVDTAAYSVAQLPKEISFLLIGRLLGNKGVREFAEAARRIRSMQPAIKFTLVGWIDENPDAITQQELDGWIIEGVLEFAGRLNDVRPAIAACSVYVLPSYREGTPRTVLEAMAMGRAVITTDAPGCRETVTDGDNGFLISVKSVNELVSAMQRFIDEPALIGRMGQRSRAIAEDKYDVHKVNQSMLLQMDIV